jgi:hypothetical protein
MARGKVVLAAVTVAAAVVVYAVHYQQVFEKTEMKKGVLRDIERLEAKKTQRDA